MWKVCDCGTPFDAETPGVKWCCRGCRLRGQRGTPTLRNGTLPRTGVLTGDEIEWWLEELSHKPDGIGGAVRRVLARALVELEKQEHPV